MALSLSTISRLARVLPAWFKASKAMPEAIEASPITAMCWVWESPRNWSARAMPRAAEIEVELCPVPKVS